MRSYSVLTVMVSVAFIFLLSCKTAKLVYYVHEPTQDFYETLNFEDDKIKEFIQDDIFFCPDITTATHTDNWVRIGLHSLSKAKEVKILTAIISTPDGTYKKEITPNQKYKLDKNEYSKDIYNKTIILFNIKNDTLEKLTKNGMISLNISYETNQDTINTISFKMKRKVEEYVEWLSQ